ncbi:von Willebrand factor type A domain protein [Rhodopirellula islandica]|uniref:von Willebrand factor type A domain protein n=1 Tax=Rhodopirellula islandica TaxID=595434 RepID=A0A0J1E9B2_RHOIS|nr:VWA domain-containing protein [Rhodopirellula islandica]KLU02084.1 von Willebrand factor type A domain protein [Rhodopirellula islandica]
MIDVWNAFHFIRPTCLFLIPIAFGLAWAWHRSHDPLRGWRNQIDSNLLDALVHQSGPPSKHGWQRLPAFTWLLVGWIVSVVAIAGPTWRVEANPFAQDAQPLIILMKADETMASAAQTTTPLQRAALKVADLAKARPGAPLGLIAYSGSAHTVLPPTEDTSVVADMAAEISPAIMPVAGDALDQAITEAGRLINRQEGGATLLIIANQAILDPQQVAAAHQAIGSPPIEILSLLPEESQETESLQAIAKTLGGKRIPLTIDDQDIQSIVQYAERRSSSGLAGQSDRWRESGYWLSPLLAAMVAWSFRRERTSHEDAS